MKPEYAQWIRDWVAERRSRTLPRDCPESLLVRGGCGTATEDMVKAFPELRRVRGHYGSSEHWWCVTPDGTIVDPTAAQFEPGREYVEYVGPDPVGKCMGCGAYVWESHPRFGSSACSTECGEYVMEEYA